MTDYNSISDNTSITGHRYFRKDAIEWSDLCASETSLSEHKEVARIMVQQMLGYVPLPGILARHEPFIRALIAQRKAGNITQQAFLDDLRKCIVLLRNDDMHMDCWMLRMAYTFDDYVEYETTLAEYKDQSRARITKLLGYAPDLRFSLDAEIFLRKYFAMEGLDPFKVTDADYTVITAIKYREAYLTKGKDAANALPLCPKLVIQEIKS